VGGIQITLGKEEMKMEKQKINRTEKFMLEIPGIRVNVNEREALETAVKVLNEQSNQLGLLDPLDAEPAVIFFAEEENR
jgi:hypothetical protein